MESSRKQKAQTPDLLLVIAVAAAAIGLSAIAAGFSALIEPPVREYATAQQAWSLAPRLEESGGSVPGATSLPLVVQPEEWPASLPPRTLIGSGEGAWVRISLNSLPSKDAQTDPRLFLEKFANAYHQRGSVGQPLTGGQVEKGTRQFSPGESAAARAPKSAEADAAP